MAGAAPAITIVSVEDKSTELRVVAAAFRPALASVIVAADKFMLRPSAATKSTPDPLLVAITPVAAESRLMASVTNTRLEEASVPNTIEAVEEPLIVIVPVCAVVPVVVPAAEVA